MRDNRTPIRRLVQIGAFLPLLVGCTSLPTDSIDISALASRWHATLPHGGSSAALLDWWKTFKDPALSQLLAAAEANSPTLDAAVSQIEKARATLDTSQAGFLPSVTGNGSVSRSGTNGSPVRRIGASTTSSGGLDASWELDLFGKNRQTAEAARQRVDEQTQNWYNARVTLAAEVATNYVNYRACRQLQSIYASQLASERATLTATETSVKSGLKAPSDLSLVKASAASAASSLTSQDAACQILIKSLTQLVALDEGEVSEILKLGSTAIPRPERLRVDAVPAEVIRQRPDINALERELAATIAEIGAAQADLYPSFSFSGSLTVSYSTLTGQGLPWSFGPAVSIPLFDGGTRLAAVKSKEAAYKGAVAQYKSGVLSAINDIESAMVNISGAERQIGDLATSVKNYRAYFEAIDKNWRAGGASVLDREQARRQAESADLTLVATRRDAVVYWISLYKALGGSWQARAVDAAAPQKTRPNGA